MPFEALQYQSTITYISQNSSILEKHGIEVSRVVPVRTPLPNERSCHAPKGSNKLRYAAWSQKYLKAGALLPLRPYFVNYLNHVKIAPFQLQTNGYRIVSALKSLFHIQRWGEPSLEEICYLLCLKKTPPRAHGGAGFFYLASWPQEPRLLEDIPSKTFGFKDKFFWTGALKGCHYRSFNRARIISILDSFTYFCWLVSRS